MRLKGIIKTVYSNRKDNLHPSDAAILQNAHEPLKVPTYEGTNQVVHPSVIDFLTEHGLPKWGGYRFWMVITPFPHGNDAFENPSVFVSDDGINWFLPPKIKNPIDCALGGWKNGFNSDPDMVYDPSLDEIRVYFRYASTNELIVKMLKIDKNMIISNPINAIYQSPYEQVEITNRSLCIWRESAYRWHMWGGGGSNKPPYYIYHRFSEDGINWSIPEKCLNYEDKDPFQDMGFYNWHFSCKPNNRKKRIEFLSYAKPISNSTNGAILYAECCMNSPTVISAPIKKPLLLPSTDSWDNGSLYRCSFCFSDHERYYRIWYSAQSKKGIWRLGYTGGYIYRDGESK